MARASGYRQPGNWATLKAKVLRDNQRDHGGRCYLCPNQATTVDHVVPVSQGGTHRLTNLAGICVPCHTAKSERERLAAIESNRIAKYRPVPRHPGAL